MSATILQQRVLVLNRLWQAINVCSAERAISLLYTGHAQVVNVEENTFDTFSFREWCATSDARKEQEVIKTISLRIPVPKIILLAVFDKLPKKDVKLTRKNLFERDKNRCQYCYKTFDRKHLNIDHVVPRQKGGQTSWVNVVCSCIRCNRIKANRTPQEAGMALMRSPKKPHSRPFVEIKFSKTPDHSWRHFVDPTYWQVRLEEV